MIAGKSVGIIRKITYIREYRDNDSWDGKERSGLIGALEVESTRFILGFRYGIRYGKLERSI